MSSSPGIVPAPIDPERLRPVLEPDLPAARTLPAEAYTSDAVLKWEREHFFEGSWVCVGRTEDLAEPGDQKAVRVGSEGILLVRGRDRALRGFFNTCRHRGHELLRDGESTNLNAIKCPYHAWVYGLDGSLNGAPRFSNVPGFRKDEYPLVETSTTEWLGWVFVNADGRAAPFADHIGNLGELVCPWEPERCLTAQVHHYEANANWKTIVENYPEAAELPDFDPSYASEFWDVTNKEDFAACESVFRGLESEGYRQGPFAREEDEVHAFMHMTARGYLNGRITKAPELAHEQYNSEGRAS